MLPFWYRLDAKHLNSGLFLTFSRLKILHKGAPIVVKQLTELSEDREWVYMHVINPFTAEYQS